MTYFNAGLVSRIGVSDHFLLDVDSLDMCNVEEEAKHFSMEQRKAIPVFVFHCYSQDVGVSFKSRLPHCLAKCALFSC